MFVNTSVKRQDEQLVITWEGEGLGNVAVYMFEDPEIMTMGSAQIKGMLEGRHGLTSWRVISKQNENVANLELTNIMKKYGFISE